MFKADIAVYLAAATVGDKNQAGGKFRGFHRFLTKCESFPDESFEHWLSFNTDKVIPTKVFPTFE